MPDTTLPPLDEIRSVVIVKPSSLGDVVHALPAVHRLKQARPGLEIRWVVNTEWEPILEGNPDLAATVPFPRREMRGLRGLRSAWAFRGVLRRLGPTDLVVDLQGLLRSALIGRALRPACFVGLGDAREGAASFYSHVVATDRSRHAVDRYLEVPRAFGVDGAAGGPPAFPMPAGRRPPGLPSGPFVVLHPFARGQGKSLSDVRVREFAARLAPMPVVVVGRRAERIEGLPATVVDLTNATSLTELIGVLRAAAFVVSVDSGPMHMAAALGDRVLGIHTWTNPNRVGPYPGGSLVWKAGRICPRSELDVEEEDTDAVVAAADVEAIATRVLEELAAPGSAGSPGTAGLAYDI